MIPTREECLRLMGEYGMLENIVAHSLEVARVALILSIELNKKGQKIDLGLVEAALIARSYQNRVPQDKGGPCSDMLSALKGNRIRRIGEVVAQHIWVCKEGIPPQCLRRDRELCG